MTSLRSPSFRHCEARRAEAIALCILVHRHTLVKVQGRVLHAARFLALASGGHGVLRSPSETQHTAVVLPVGRFQGL